MVVYLSFYLFPQFKINREQVYNLVLIACLSVSIITILLYICYILQVPQEFTRPLLGVYNAGSSTGQRRVYFLSQLVLFSGLSTYLFQVLLDKVTLAKFYPEAKNAKSFFLTMWFTMCILFFTASKGFMLGYIYVLVAIFIAEYWHRILVGRINKKLFSFALLIITLVAILIALGYINIFSAIFSQEDEANIGRFEQLFFLLGDLTWLGKGLGAVIPGYTRNEEQPYGFELSYLNLVHKFGLFAAFIVVSYFIVIARAIGHIRKRVNTRYAVMALGLMAYLLPSIGNPTLFAPQAVFLNCFAIFLLRKDEKN